MNTKTPVKTKTPVTDAAQFAVFYDSYRPVVPAAVARDLEADGNLSEAWFRAACLLALAATVLLVAACVKLVDERRENAGLRRDLRDRQPAAPKPAALPLGALITNAWELFAKPDTGVSGGTPMALTNEYYAVPAGERFLTVTNRPYVNMNGTLLVNLDGAEWSLVTNRYRRHIRSDTLQFNGEAEEGRK